ncbi:DNA invertase [Enterococcus florum]|uniref:DNA invertase n=1 Tax=Enterococcus florum TaxID=2480627 RepID=A0A4P5P740_9ENTE|nr:recombinase family protein [Enterococcus florum]GCF93600.1 DNA invertase [Enterococcus florum]
MVRQREKRNLEQLREMEQILIGYARVSSTDDRQKLGLKVQTDALKDCDIIFSEKQSGDNDNRPELTRAIKLAKELTSQGKTVTFKIYKLDRLSRKMFTLANLIDDFNQNGIKLISILENIETDSLTGRLLCIVLGYVAEIELENIRIRTKDGLRKARENGVVLGNPSLTDKQETEILYLYQMNTIPISLIAKRLKVSESSVYKVARKYGVSRRNNSKIAIKV